MYDAKDWFPRKIITVIIAVNKLNQNAHIAYK